MTDVPARNCGECAFWNRLHDVVGICRRHAPEATFRSDEVAHWPETREGQFCGEGRVSDKGLVATCASCLYWRRKSTGLNPVDRGDMPKAWWSRAGICVRGGPRPSAEPGPRAFWQATGGEDGCGDGVERQGGAPDPN